MRAFALPVAVAFALMAWPAAVLAASTVYASGPGRACYRMTAEGRSDDTTLQECNRAVGKRDQLSVEDYTATLSNRGVVHLRRRDGAAALADFDAVLAIDDRNAEAHLNRGAALVILRQHGPAVAAITTALRYGVKDPHKAYFNRATAREALRDYRGAYEDYTTALTIQPDWGPAEEELARFARGRRETLAARLSETAAEEGGSQQQ